MQMMAALLSLHLFGALLVFVLRNEHNMSTGSDTHINSVGSVAVIWGCDRVRGRQGDNKGRKF